jgi:CRISPR-associated endonuclease/helicase Cas3
LQGRPPFRLNEGDASDKAVAQRLGASKRLRLVSLREAEQDKQVAQVAWELATRSGKPARVVVFCDRRDRKDGGRGPSAQGVRDAVEEMAKGDRRAGRPKTDIHPPELLVGARRVWERQRVAACLRKLGFIGGDGPPDKPAFLIATAAGEVGVDIDADHMVSDLVSWERMVQRLGRVNRRGKGDAEVVVLWGEPSIRNADAPTESERRALIAFASKGVIESLPHANGAFDASPGALRRLAECARQDADFKARIDKATISEPLRPGLTRALVDAWSMTSLKEHTGRPEVAPWLRGWVEEVPQTTVIWRMHIPVRIDSRGRAAPASRAEIEDFFEATPPHDSEKLETETHRVLSWLADLLKDDKRGAVSGSTDDEDRDSAESAVNGGNAETPEANLAESAVLWAARPKRNDIAALVLSPGGAYSDGLTVRDLAQEGKDKKDLHEAIVGKVVVIDARLGGVKDGLLNPKSLNTAETADSFPARSEDTLRHWSEQARFCVRRARSLSDDEVEGWRFEHAFPLCRDDEGGVQEWLIVEHYKDAAQQEDARSISNPQELAVHRDLTRAR